MAKRRRALSASGLLVALVVAFLVLPVLLTMHAVSAWFAGVPEYTLIVATLILAYAAGRLWDKLTGARREEIRGRRSWAGESVETVQRVQEMYMLIGMTMLAIFWFGGLIALWASEQTGLFWAMVAMTVVGTALVWSLTRKRRPYRWRERRRQLKAQETTPTADESVSWVED